MRDSTTPSKAYDGYGYLWWLDGGGTYRASGIFGQGISINPSENVVIAIHSARAAASKDEDWDLQTALYAALTEALKE
jgi:CubicO group peptidase (beta-lactamase class C family)